RTALWTVSVVARPAGEQPTRRRRGDPAGLSSRMNRHGVRPGRFHVHLSSAPTGFLVGGLIAADTRVPLPADAGVSLGPGRPHQRQTRRGGNRNMLPRQLRVRQENWLDARALGGVGTEPEFGSNGRGSNMAPLACSTEMNDAMVSNIAASTC